MMRNENERNERFKQGKATLNDFIEEQAQMSEESSDEEEFVDPRNVLDLAKNFLKPVKWQIIWEVNQCLSIPEPEQAYSV